MILMEMIYLVCRSKQIAAYVIALGVGLLYGVSLAPFQKWFDTQDTSDTNALVCRETI